jgi:hypothetical protein
VAAGLSNFQLAKKPFESQERSYLPPPDLLLDLEIMFSFFDFYVYKISFEISMLDKGRSAL